jgi:hypothetical protein
VFEHVTPVFKWCSTPCRRQKLIDTERNKGRKVRKGRKRKMKKKANGKYKEVQKERKREER